MKWYNLYHVYIFHKQTKVFSWMVAASSASNAKHKTIQALALYYPDLKVRDFMITIKKDEADVLV